MATDVVATFFSLLLIGGLLGLVGILVRPPLRTQFGSLALPLMGVIATGATLGSLYFSEVADFLPCKLCWYQRIGMYPLAAILVIAAARKDVHVVPYALSIAAGGLAVSAYHVQLQWFPDQGTSCDIASPCTAKWVEGLGFMTIPQMAGLSFVLIIGLGVLAMTHQRSQTI